MRLLLALLAASPLLAPRAVDECVEVLCAVPSTIEVSTGSPRSAATSVIVKVQKLYRLCGNPKTLPMPETASCVIPPKKVNAKLTTSKELAVEEVEEACACAPVKPGATPCEILTPKLDGKEEWGKAPTDTVLPAGKWRGDCLKILACVETEARESSGGPGSTIPQACRGEK